MSKLHGFRLACVATAIAVVLLGTGAGSAVAQSKGKAAPPVAPNAAQVIPGYPLKISVLDNTQMSVQYSNPLIGLSEAQQFYSDYAEAIYLWAQHDLLSVPKVYGPATMPGGHSVNPYTSVSNTLTGSGTSADPWVVTTINDVPGTKFRLTQHTTYVNGAEYVKLHYHLEQMGGTETMLVTLFHAADLTTASSDGLGLGYQNATTGAIGDYAADIQGRNVYQQFVPDVSNDYVAAYQEGTYESLWDRIGDVVAPGVGFNNTIIYQLHDTAFGLQWNVKVPEIGDVSFGDTMFFGPHENLAGSFIDVAADNYCYDYVYNMGAQGIANGYSDGTFRPGNNVTRGQLSKMMVVAMGWPIDTTGGPHFTDVPVDNPFYGYVETAYNHHIINGYDDQTFRPNAAVTRGQAMKFVVRAMGWEIDTSGGPHYTDVPVGSIFYDYIETANNHGIIHGYDDGTFRYGKSMTRGQISKVLDLSGMLR